MEWKYTSTNIAKLPNPIKEYPRFKFKINNAQNLGTNIYMYTYCYTPLYYKIWH